MTFVNKFPKSFPFDNLMLFKLSNGDKEIRTPDPLLARQVLSHLSYTPTFAGFLRIRLPLRILPDPQN